jgi:hypothetical protein
VVSVPPHKQPPERSGHPVRPAVSRTKRRPRVPAALRVGPLRRSDLARRPGRLALLGDRPLSWCAERTPVGCLHCTTTATMRSLRRLPRATDEPEIDRRLPLHWFGGSIPGWPADA